MNNLFDDDLILIEPEHRYQLKSDPDFQFKSVTTLADADSGSFIAYDSITKDNAIAWAQAAMGDGLVKQLDEDIAEQITASKNPTTTIGVPW